MNYNQFREKRDSFFQEIREMWKTEYNYFTLSERIEPIIATRNFGCGGRTMIRGPLCPNFLEEYVVGNIRRGRLCAKAKKPDYIYYYDNQNRLVKVDKQTEIGICTEYIVRNGNTSYGFNFSGKDHLQYGILAAIIENGHIGATIFHFHSLIKGASRPGSNNVWIYEYKDDHPLFAVNFTAKERENNIRSDIIFDVAFRLEYDEKKQIVKYAISNPISMDTDRFEKEDYVDLVDPIPMEVWSQTYGLC